MLSSLFSAYLFWPVCFDCASRSVIPALATATISIEPFGMTGTNNEHISRERRRKALNSIRKDVRSIGLTPPSIRPLPIFATVSSGNNGSRKNWIQVFRPKIESLIEILNQKLQMADMAKMRLTEPAPGTSSKVEMEIASELTGRSIRSAVSLTEDHIQFQHYRRSSAQSVSVGHNVIGLDDFTTDKVNEVLIDVLDAFTRDFPK
jgi:hypothetical protein